MWRSILMLMLSCLVLTGTWGCAGSSTEAPREPEQEPVPASQIELERSVHFFASEPGEPVIVEAGLYRVRAHDDDHLYLERADGWGVVVPAETGEHGEDVAEPVASIEVGGEDEVHLVQFYPGGATLVATGSYSGIVSRGQRTTTTRQYELQAVKRQQLVQKPPPNRYYRAPSSRLQLTEPIVKQYGEAEPTPPAAVGLQTAQHSFDPTPGSSTSLSAQCPSGTQVLGGGFYGIPVNLDMDVTASAPSGNGWLLGISNNDPYNTRSVTVYAICGSDVGSVEIAQYAFSPTPGGASSPSAQCPTGTQATGGGFWGISTNLDMRVVASAPTGNGWVVGVFNYDPYNTNTVTAYVVCASGVTGRETAQQPFDPTPGGSTALSAQCPTGKQASGGGFWGLPTNLDMKVTASAPSGNGFLLGVHNNDPYNSSTVTSYAVCIDGPG